MKKLFKKLYAIFPFKKQIFRGIKKIGKPPGNVYKHLHFKGKFKIDIDPGKSFEIIHYGFEIENELFWRGIQNGWEKVSLGLWIQLSQISDVIFDIGANTGVYSLVARTINSNARVFAFEPVERTFNKLIKNCLLNKYDDIICFQKAVSNYSGRAIIYDSMEEGILSVTVNQNLQNSSTKVKECEIETVTLKNIIKENKIQKIDLMKIDVETHEPEVLEGFGEYLKIFQPTLLIEILSDEAGERIKALIEGIDYLYFNIDENNGIRQVSVIGRSDYYNYLFCRKEIAQKLKLLN